MTLQALVNDPDDGQLTNIKITDTLFIESVNRIITYHHKNGKIYRVPQRLEDFEKSSALKFMKLIRLDHRNFVKVSAIQRYDKEKGLVFFDNDSGTKEIKYAHVADKNAAFLNLSLGLKEEPLEMYTLVINEEENDLVNINIDDCLKIESVNRVITYHHKNGHTYCAPQKMRDFSTSLAIRNLGILRLDHRNFVNLNSIRLFDKEKGFVYFEEEPKPGSKKAYVAGKNRSFLEIQLEISDTIEKNDND